MKKIWFGVGVVAIIALLLLQTRFKTYMQVDYNGYAIEDKTVRTMLLADLSNDKVEKSAELYSFNVLDYIYSRGNSYYMGEGKKTKVDLSFPLLINDGAGVWFIDDSTTLFNTKYERFSTYRGLTVSERVSYNLGGERAADDEYLFAGMKNGFFINLDSFTINKGTAKEIPMNSLIYFTENYFKYCEIDDNMVTCKVVDNILPTATVTVGDEELTYKQLLINLRVLYDSLEIEHDEKIDELPPVEIPPVEVIEDVPTDENNDDDDLRVPEDLEGHKRQPREPRTQQGGGGGGGSAKRGGAGTSGSQDARGVRPDSLRPDKQKDEEPLKPIEGYVKPTVEILDTDARVYRVIIQVKVDDPAARIDRLRKVQFEFYEQLPNGKETLSYRSYTSASGKVTAGNGGIKPDTTYRINAYFTYLDEYDERVTESIASDIIVTTGSLSEVGSVIFKVGDENGVKYMDIPYYYDKYAEIVNVTYVADNDADDEAIYGIDPKFLQLTATKSSKDYITNIESSVAAQFKKGTVVSFTTLHHLEPKSTYSYVITAKDFFGNDLTMVNNTGTFSTCKSRPVGSIEVTNNEISNIKFKVKAVDPDDASIAPQGGSDPDREVYLVVSTRKIDSYSGNDTLWDDVQAYIQNSNSRVNFNQPDEGTVHFVERINTVTFDANGLMVIPETEITANVLDLNTKYYVYMLADFDLDNKKGPVYHGEIADISFKSATLSSLGNIYVNVEVKDISAHGANIYYTLNSDRTNDTLQSLLSDVLFTIDTPEGDTPGIHSAILFDDTAMNSFTGYDRQHNAITNPVTVSTISMDNKYFKNGEDLSDSEKARVIAFTDLKGNKPVAQSPAYYLQSKTTYNITPIMYAEYNGKKYDMNVTLSKSSFKTMREPAKVVIKDLLLAAGTLRFKVKIEDPDETITGNSGHVVVLNLYDSHRHLVKAIRVPKNTDDFISYDFTGLDSNETFFMNFIAVEYNEGYDNSTFESNKLIHQEIVNNNIDISGSIKLLSLNNSTTGKLRADTRVIINDNARVLNEEYPYYISVEKNGVDITSSYDDELTTVSDYQYSSGNTINKTSSWIVDKGNNNYKMTLYVKINENVLVLDTLEFNSKDVMVEISSAQDFITKIKQGKGEGRYVVTADIDMDDVDLNSDGTPKSSFTSANIVSTFKGEIDFQGYTLHKNKYNNEAALFSNLSPKAEIHNAVFEFSDDSKTRLYENGFLTHHNYGHIHDIIVHYTGGSGLQNTVYGLVACRNAASGIIERFVVKNDPAEGLSTFTARTSAGLVVYLNDGIIRNGYVYGSDINAVTSNVSVGGTINIGGIAGYQNPRGQTSNVFSLVNVLVSNPDMNSLRNHDTQYGAVIGYAAGSSKHMYSVGQSFYNEVYEGKKFDADRIGPVLGTSVATQKDVYYWNENNAVYTKATRQTLIGLESLYDYNFQGSLLGSGFDAQPVEVGFYPHVIMNEELPEQEYIDLPARIMKNLVEVVSTEVESYGADGNSAVIKFRLNNPRNAAITAIEIENLTTELLEDDAHKTVMLDGYTTLYATVSDPVKYLSNYKILKLTAHVGNGTQTVSSEALLSVDFYRLIRTPDDWYNYVVLKPTENARLAADIDFGGVTDTTKIRVTATYTGKLDGGEGLGGLEKEANETRPGHTLKNINFTGSGYDPVLFSRVDGYVSNICVENFTANVPNRAYNCLIASLYGEVSNVHMNNVRVTGKNYLAALVGYGHEGASIENCSATDVKLIYSEPANTNTEGQMGGIAARADASRIVNCFVRDINITANDLRSCIGAGAIVGYSGTSVLDRLYATGDITVRGNYVGGLIGYHSASNISNVMSNLISRVNVKSYQDKVGGMIGGMNMTEAPIDTRNNMSGVALGNVLCVNTDSEDVSFTTGYMGGHNALFYGADFQLFNGITNAKFDSDGLLLKVDPEEYLANGGVISNKDKNTLGLISYDQAKDPATYTSSSLLGMDSDAFDYSYVTREKLPILYYNGTSIPMPFQEDELELSLIKVNNNLITVSSVFVNENQSRITLQIEGPVGYKITGYEFEKDSLGRDTLLTTMIGTPAIESYGGTRLPMNYSATQNHYLDSYMLTKIHYTNADGTVIGVSNFEANPVRIPLTLFVDIDSVETWNRYINLNNNYGNYENYKIVKNIDFGGNKTYERNAKLGRLRGDRKDSEPGIIKLSNINITNNNENFIFRLNSELSAMRFENCSVASGGRDCTGLVGVSSGAVYDMEFINVQINCRSNNQYTGLIGFQNGGCVGKYDPTDESKGKVYLNNVTVVNTGTNCSNSGVSTASYHMGGVVGSAKGNTMFENIHAEKVSVRGNGYVGGIIGSAGKARFKHIRAKDFTVESYNRERVGGIIGSFTPGRISSKTAAYFTDVSLTGTPSVQDGYTDTSSTTVSFIKGNLNASTPSSQIGGLIGYADVYWLGRDANGTRTSRVSTYDSSETNVSLLVDGIVVKGYMNQIGGLFGFSDACNYDCHCYNSLITAVDDTTGAAAYSHVGGISGQCYYENYYNVTKNTLIRIKNHNYVGLLVGYQSASAAMNYCKVEDSRIELDKTSSVTAELKNVGGLTGYNYYPINYSIANNVSIVAPKHNNVGGLTGYANNTITRCLYYASPQEPETSPEAYVAYVVKGLNNVGGIAGYHYTGTIQYSYSNASVFAENNYAGGISGVYRNGYILTTISNKPNYSYSTASMHNNYFAGMVRAKDFAGGLVGSVSMKNLKDNTKAAENAGRRKTADTANDLIKTGANDEVAYTCRNLCLASVIKSNSGTNAYAFAGNVDGFEGKANRYSASTAPYNVDKSSVDRADVTFFWSNIQFETTGSDTVTLITELKRDDAPALAKNEITVTYPPSTTPARYVEYTNDRESKYGNGALEMNSRNLNVRLVNSNDLTAHGPYYSMQWTNDTSGNTNPMWRGKYMVMLTQDTKIYPAPYLTYGYSVGKSYLPHIRINDIGNYTASDFLTNYQVRKGLNLPIPTGIITRQRRLMAARPMGAPTITAPVVYTSDVDKINVEFAQDALSGNGMYMTYLKVYYGNEDKPSISLLVDRRVYSFEYDFAKKIRLDYGYAKVGEFIADQESKGLILEDDYLLEDVLDKPEFLHSDTSLIENTPEADENEEVSNSSGTDSDVNEDDENSSNNGASSSTDKDGNVYIYRPSQLTRHVMTYSNAYYYITDGGVIKGYGTSSSEKPGCSDDSARLIAGEFVNLYNGRGLEKDGSVVDLVNEGTISSAPIKGISLSEYTVPIEIFTLNSSRINTYYNYSTIGAGEDAIDRDSQILKSKNGNINIIHSSLENVKDSVVMYTKDGDEYLTVLGTDGIIIDLYNGDDINAPKDFKRGGIVYMTNNFETTAPFVLVEYQNGGIVGFDYMTGKFLFDNSINNTMSLLDYVKVYFEEEKSQLTSAPKAYTSTKKVIDYASTPDRLESFAYGINNGEEVDGNSTDTEITAKSNKDGSGLADETNALKAGEDTKLKDPDKDSGLITDKKDDIAIASTKKSGDEYFDPADGSKGDGDSLADGISRGIGATGEKESASESGGSGDITAMEEGGSTLEGGTSKVSGKSEGDGEGIDDLPEPDLYEGNTSKEKNVSSDGANGTGHNKFDAGSYNPSKAASDTVDSQSDEKNGDISTNTMASTTADSPADHSGIIFDDGTTDGIEIAKPTPSIKDKSIEDEPKVSGSDDTVYTEKRLMTVYNQSTGTYEIIDMDQFLNSKDYKSENDRLAIRDFGVYGGYATAEKPKDEDQRNGVLLYILVSIALLVGVSGGIYYKKKHKVKI